MPTFTYQAINENGKTLKGTILAESADAAAELLGGRGLLASRLQERRRVRTDRTNTPAWSWFNHTPTADLILFTKQFSTLFRSGVPMMTILDLLAAQSENARLAKVILSMRQAIKEGARLYEAFRQHPGIFSPLYCAMIHAGEVSGSLPKVMERLKYILEHEQKVRSDIRSAMFYPAFVMALLVLAFFVLLGFVLPKFVTILSRSGVALPMPTQIAMGLYGFLTAHGAVLLAGILAAAVAITVYLRTDQGRFTRDYLLIKVPVIGPVVIKSAMSRFSSIFSILQSSGIAILESMTILSETIGNAAISKEFDRIREMLEEGRGIAAPLKSARYFTPMVVNMVAVGEESGNLEEMMEEVAEHYDEELAYAIKKMTNAVGPILIIALAVMVGFFAVAIFLPIADLTKMYH
ncbi:MAG TPA: type II secretion system F family protein [Desulfosarcina sp.]|nr:type II secretion system F family protein [Desulfosarcina sp.]